MFFGFFWNKLVFVIGFFILWDYLVLVVSKVRGGFLGIRG